MKSESEKNRRSSTSRIVDITETLGTSQGRTRQVVVEGGKRLGVVRRCVDERVLQGKKKGEKEEDRNMTGFTNGMEKKKRKRRTKRQA